MDKNQVMKCVQEVLNKILENQLAQYLFKQQTIEQAYKILREEFKHLFQEEREEISGVDKNSISLFVLVPMFSLKVQIITPRLLQKIKVLIG